jgi:hypothetical protein
MRTVAILALSTLLGCSTAFKTAAVQTAVAAKPVVDGAANSWSSFVDCKIKQCSHLTTREEKIDCLGVAADAKDVEAIFEIIYSAQLAIFIAVSADEPHREVASAVQDLTSSIKHLVQFFNSNQLSIKEISTCPAIP